MFMIIIIIVIIITIIIIIMQTSAPRLTLLSHIFVTFTIVWRGSRYNSLFN